MRIQVPALRQDESLLEVHPVTYGTELAIRAFLWRSHTKLPNYPISRTLKPGDRRRRSETNEPFDAVKPAEGIIFV